MANLEGAPAALIEVTLVHAPAAREVHECALHVAPGCTAAQALAQSGWLTQFPELSSDAVTLGLWGRACTFAHVLEHGDRLEWYRPLRVDPKVARRERFRRQGTKGTGLFAKRRVGGKAGY